MSLHLVIIYVPFLAPVFTVAPLGLAEWKAVLWLSFPVIMVDEVLKYISRNMLHGRRFSFNSLLKLRKMPRTFSRLL